MVVGTIGVFLYDKPYTSWKSLTQMCIFFALMISHLARLLNIYLNWGRCSSVVQYEDQFQIKW